MKRFTLFKELQISKINMLNKHVSAAALTDGKIVINRTRYYTVNHVKSEP